MNIIQAYPPNIDQIDAAFNSKRLQGILYAYGKSIFNPSAVDVPPWLVAHEAVHGYRQMNREFDDDTAPEAQAFASLSIDDRIKFWWHQYINDREFRFAEELVAHAAEYRYFYRAHPGDRRVRQLYLKGCAERLSGPLYGRLLTFENAKDQIKRIALQSEGGE